MFSLILLAIDVHLFFSRIFSEIVNHPFASFLIQVESIAWSFIFSDQEMFSNTFRLVLNFR